MAVCPFADQSRRYDAAYPMSYTSGPWRGVLHTTETTGLPGYDGGAKAPHFTVVPGLAAKTVVVYQHFDTSRPSRALANTSIPGETNREQCIQIELVGTSGWICSVAPKSPALFWPEAPEWALAGLARLMRWIEAAHGMPSVSTPRPWVPWNGPRVRMSAAEWDTFTGWCGHQHVPENDHTDPGALPIARLLAGSAAVSPEEDDMPLTDADVQRVAAAVANYPLGPVRDASGAILAGAAGGVPLGVWVTDTRVLAGDAAIRAGQVLGLLGDLPAAVRAALADVDADVDADDLAGRIAAQLAKGTTLTVTATAPGVQ